MSISHQCLLHFWTAQSCGICPTADKYFNFGTKIAHLDRGGPPLTPSHSGCLLRRGREYRCAAEAWLKTHAVPLTLTRQELVTTCLESTTSTSGSFMATLRMQVMSNPYTFSHPAERKGKSQRSSRGYFPSRRTLELPLLPEISTPLCTNPACIIHLAP